MPADLTKPFSESCCDGGECNPNDMSAQPCGCDPGLRHYGKVVGYVCERHRLEKELAEKRGNQTT
jgi:hypothetical protein